MWCGATRRFRRRGRWTITSPACVTNWNATRTSPAGLSPFTVWDINWRCEMRAKQIIRGNFMNSKIWTFVLTLVVVSAAPAATNELGGDLQKGLFAEEVDHDFNAAITNYQALVVRYEQERQVAATAVFRLGECYRKL